MNKTKKTHKLFGAKVEKKIPLRKRLKSLDPISWFMIVTLLGFLGVMLVLLLNLQKEAEATQAGDEYYDDLLNFTLKIPHGWEGAKPDEHHVKEVVREVTGGILFDMQLHSLTDELVPLALIMQPEEGSEDPFAKFMTLAFRGSDDEYTYLDDKVKLMDDFKALLKSSEHTDIKVKEVKEINNSKLSGIIIDATAKLADQKIHYVQYLEPAGANIMAVTYGSTIKSNGVKDITTVLDTLIYHEGGEFAPTPIQEDMIEETKKQDALDEENAKQEESKPATPTTPITPWGAPTSKDGVPTEDKK